MNTNLKMVNVPSDSLIVLHSEKITRKANVKMFQSGTISLNGFAITQLLEGFSLLVQSYSSISTLKEHTNLSLKIAKGIATAVQLGGNAEYLVSYSEVRILKEWLEARMRHCEQERDKRVTWPHDRDALKFNPDTYIGQKLLLLDLRELLLGEVIATETDHWDGDNSAQQ